MATTLPETESQPHCSFTGSQELPFPVPYPNYCTDVATSSSSKSNYYESEYVVPADELIYRHSQEQSGFLSVPSLETSANDDWGGTDATAYDMNVPPASYWSNTANELLDPEHGLNSSSGSFRDVFDEGSSSVSPCFGSESSLDPFGTSSTGLSSESWFPVTLNENPIAYLPQHMHLDMEHPLYDNTMPDTTWAETSMPCGRHNSVCPTPDRLQRRRKDQDMTRCPKCSAHQPDGVAKFVRRSGMARHMREVHGAKRYVCPCGYRSGRKGNFTRHREKHACVPGKKTQLTKRGLNAKA